MEAPNEHNLLVRASQGDHSAHRFIIDFYKDYVYNLALKITRNAEDAEEVAQDSFLKAFRGLANFKKEAKFSTWLYSITYHTAVSKIRKKKLPQTSLDAVEHPDKWLSNFDSAVDQLHTNQQKEYLALAMGTLKPDERGLLTLYYLQEKNIEEVATIVKIKPNNVKVKIHRARKKLYDQLNKILKKEAKNLL